jgi:hypothetical protein
MKLNNVFTPSSLNSLQYTTPVMAGAGGGGGAHGVAPSANLGWEPTCYKTELLLQRLHFHCYFVFLKEIKANLIWHTHK